MTRRANTGRRRLPFAVQLYAIAPLHAKSTLTRIVDGRRFVTWQKSLSARSCSPISDSILTLPAGNVGGMELTREMECMEPDGAMYDLIMGADPATLTQEQLVTFTILVRRLKAACEWAELEALGHVEDTTELAMATKVSEPALARSQETATALVTHPATANLFRRGAIDLSRFPAIHERTRHLTDPAMVAEVDHALAEVAAGLTRTQLCRK